MRAEEEPSVNDHLPAPIGSRNVILELAQEADLDLDHFARLLNGGERVQH